MKETLYNDDCLKILKSISDKSIDIVIIEINKDYFEIAKNRIKMLDK